MQRALVWLNLSGHEAVRHKLKNSLKTQKMPQNLKSAHVLYEWALVKNCTGKSRFKNSIFSFLNRILSDLRIIHVLNRKTSRPKKNVLYT